MSTHSVSAGKVSAPVRIPARAVAAAWRTHAWLAAGAIGFLAFCISWIVADRLVLTSDEGIFLNSGVSVLRGAVPYRDFFANTGPGTFWLLAAVFRIFGVTLRGAHLLVALDLWVIIGLTYWLTSRLTGAVAAFWSAMLCAALFLSSPTNVVINHRWDANALAFASIAAGAYAIESSKRTAAFLAGVLGILAAWVTPPVGLVAIVIALRLLLDTSTRRLGILHLGGAALGVLAPAVYLGSQGGLTPMIQSLVWNASHYSTANRVPYGFVFGGMTALFAGVHGIEWVQRVLFLIPFLLPATLPPLAALAWAPALRSPRRMEVFLLLCGGALVASNYPRCDLLHLLYVCPIFVVLGAAWLQRNATRFARAMVLLAILLPAAAMCRQNLAAANETAVDTRVGTVRVSDGNAPAVRMSLAHVRPGDSLFVFPYEPMFYFLTGGRNPTRYFWLQPGMMSDDDERTALAELRAHPPEWILFRDLQPRDYLRIWPGTDPARLRMPSIEEFIRARYQFYDRARNGDGERLLLKRR